MVANVAEKEVKAINKENSKNQMSQKNCIVCPADFFLKNLVYIYRL